MGSGWVQSFMLILGRVRLGHFSCGSGWVQWLRWKWNIRVGELHIQVYAPSLRLWPQPSKWPQLCKVSKHSTSEVLLQFSFES